MRSVEREGAAAEVTVEVGGEGRPAVSYEAMTGPVEAGDEVVVNVAALDLGLGSGGFDVVHVNLTRGLEGPGVPGAHVMKLNYSSLQHAVEPLEERAPALEWPLGGPVAVLALHGQLACMAWAAAQRTSGARIGYVQTHGGALPGMFSRVVGDLLERGLLAGHVTAAPAFGGEHEAITVAGAIHGGLTLLGWDAVIAGPGPGIIGSASALGHGGLAALDSLHAAASLGCPAVAVPRMSEGDPRERHRGLSHHTRTVLDLCLAEVTVALPEGEDPGLVAPHAARQAPADIDAYLESGLPARTMGREVADDALFFRAALAGGAVLGEQLDGV
ncbi:MAG: DUF3866 family protein [Thermoleophilaceae bacterium]